MIAQVQTYVPGYRLLHNILFDGNRLSFFFEV